MLFEIYMRQVIAAHPRLPGYTLIKTVEKMEAGLIDAEKMVEGYGHLYLMNLQNAESFGLWAKDYCPEAVEHLMNQKKIHAIKALRDYTGAGLKEAKDAMEYVQYNILGVKQGWS